MILAIIVACEIGFWVAILAGLFARYVLKRPGLGATLLVLAPVLDVVLLVAVAIDLSAGATASWHHGLAALYIGFSLAYGHALIRWADARFAQKFAGGPRPVKPSGRAYAVKCWQDVLRTAIAVGVAGGILLAIVWWVGDAERTAALDSYLPVLGLILTIEILWAVSYSIWPKRRVEASAGRA